VDITKELGFVHKKYIRVEPATHVLPSFIINPEQFKLYKAIVPRGILIGTKSFGLMLNLNSKTLEISIAPIENDFFAHRRFPQGNFTHGLMVREFRGICLSSEELNWQDEGKRRLYGARLKTEMIPMNIPPDADIKKFVEDEINRLYNNNWFKGLLLRIPPSCFRNE
jgi:hypothetical protein